MKSREVIPGEGFLAATGTGRQLVRTVSAIWRVPGISAKEPNGRLDRGFGCQNEKGGYSFIHGLARLRRTSSAPVLLRLLERYRPSIFIPQPMHQSLLATGVEVSMTRREPHGTRPRRPHLRGRVTTTERDLGGVAPFTQAEWLQEDPTSSQTSPRWTCRTQDDDVRFTASPAERRGRSPALPTARTLMANWGVFRVPTPFAADASALSRHGYGRHTWQTYNPMDMAIDAYDVQLFGWGVAWTVGNAEANTTHPYHGVQVFGVFGPPALAPPARPGRLSGCLKENRHDHFQPDGLGRHRLEVGSPYFVAFRRRAARTAATFVLGAALGLAEV